MRRDFAKGKTALFEAVPEALSGLMIGVISGTVSFFIVLVLAFVYRYFTLEKLSSVLGIVFGLGFLGFSGGLLAILEQPTIGGVIEILVVVVFTVWGANIGDKIAEKTPKRSSAFVSGLINREPFTKIKLPQSKFIFDIAGKKRVSDYIKSELSEREFFLPPDVPDQEIGGWIKRRLSTEWGVGDAEIDVSKKGEVVHLAISARDEGLSPVIPEGNVALPVECKALPSGLAAGDFVKIIFSQGEALERVEVLGSNPAQNIVTINAPVAWLGKVGGKKAELAVALPDARLWQKLISVKRRSGSIEEFRADKIYSSLKERGISEEAAKRAVAQIENRMPKVEGPVSTDLMKHIIIEELENISPEEAKKLKKPRFWKAR